MELIQKTLQKENGKYLWEFNCPECKRVCLKQKQNGLKQKSCGCIDVPGDEPYGYLKVLFPIARMSEAGRQMYKIHCTFNGEGCLDIFEDDMKEINRGRKVSCGCYRKFTEKNTTKNLKDYTGTEVGFMKVIEQAGRDEKSLVLWRVKCRHCDNTEVISSELLRKRKSRNSACSKCQKAT